MFYISLISEIWICKGSAQHSFKKESIGHERSDGFKQVQFKTIDMKLNAPEMALIVSHKTDKNTNNQ